jgi:hypothetical protein
MGKRGPKKQKPDCDLAFTGEHFTGEYEIKVSRVRSMKQKTKVVRVAIKEPTRVNGKGKPIYLCPYGYNENEGFLTCRQAKLRGYCNV